MGRRRGGISKRLKGERERDAGGEFTSVGEREEQGRGRERVRLKGKEGEN